MNNIEKLKKELTEVENKQQDLSNKLLFELDEMYEYLHVTGFFDRYILISIKDISSYITDNVYPPHLISEKFGNGFSEFTLNRNKYVRYSLEDFYEEVNFMEIHSKERNFLLFLAEENSIKLSYYNHGYYKNNFDIFNIPYSKLESVDSFNSEIERILTENENSYNSFMESYNFSMKEKEEKDKIKLLETLDIEINNKIKLFEKIKKEIKF